MRRLDGELRAGRDGRAQDLRASARTSPRARRARTRSRPWPRPVPELFGGAADLSESNLTDVKGAGDFAADEAGPQPAVRRARARAWAASPTASPTTAGSSRTCGTFLNFSDYMRGSVRLAALSGLHVIYVWTHDSVGLGEDGPTHQPIEHYAALRAMPEPVVRPARRRERDDRRLGGGGRSAAAARSRCRSPARSCRRCPGRPSTARDGRRAGRLRPARGAAGGPEAIDLLLIATGSELPARRRRPPRRSTPRAIRTRVVSLPCWELFEPRTRRTASRSSRRASASA